MPMLTNLLLNFTLTGLVASVLIYWLWSRREIYRFAAKYPKPMLSIKVLFRLFNNLKELLSILSGVFGEKKCNTFFVWIGVSPVLFTADPDLSYKILLSPDMVNKSTAYRAFKTIMGEGLVTSEAEVWQNHRRKINPAFNNRTLLSFMSIFNIGKNTVCSMFEAMSDNNKQYDVEQVIRRIIVETTIATIMGKTIKEGDLVDEEFITTYYKVLEVAPLSFVTSLLHLDFFLIFFSKKIAEFKRIILRFVKNITVQQMSHPSAVDITRFENNPLGQKKTPTNFIHQALKLYSKQEFSIDDIIGEANIIFSAAFETVSSTIFNTLCMLAMHPDIQERLFEEIENEFPSRTFEISYDQFDKLPYLDRVINETLRLYPTVPVVARRTVKSTSLDDEIILPNGLEIVISVYDIHRNVDNWGPNAHKFNPDNFLPENMTHLHQGAFIPFLKGPRNCIGWRYSYLIMKTMLIGLVRNYRFATKWKQEQLKAEMKMTFAFAQNPTLQIYRRT